jgi:predicted molibdopterin-dependent oxidoreductase YjgC
METILITVNGQPVEVPAGLTLLEALRRHGIELPTLCHDERLTPYGGCRMCVVARLDGRPGLVPACSTPVLPGMKIDTEAPEVHEARRRQLQLILLNHRMECPVCERTGDCRLQDLVFEYGGDESRLPFDLVRRPRDEASPLIVRDPEKCILCAKCVRLCDEVQGVAAIGVIGRGLEARVSTWLDGPLECEFCGQCVDACPVAALTIPSFASDIPAWQRTSVTTTCSYCSCGCELTVAGDGTRLLAVSTPPTSLPNHGKLCAKGRFGWDVLRHPDRLTQPLVRRGGRLAEASWDEALAAVASGFAAARTRGEVIAAIGSTRLTTEDAYLLQRFGRETLGTPHVSAGIDPGVEALVAGIGEALGTPRSTATIADLATADTVLVLRADPGRTHPLVKTELVTAARRGAKVLLVHPFAGALSTLAAQHLRLAPAGEEALLSGLLAELLRRRGASDAVEQLDGFAAWRAALDDYRTGLVATLTGVTPKEVGRLADRLEAADSLVVTVATGRGIPGRAAGVARRAVELLAVLGLLGRPGSGVLVLGEKVNVQGIVLAGLDPRLAAGGGVALAPGWTAAEMIRRAAVGEVGALYVLGQDLIGAWPSGIGACRAVENTRFVVVQDPFLTDTGRAADVVLPVRCLVERDGSVIGADGVRRPLRQALRPPVPLPGDGDVVREIAVRLGAPLPDNADIEVELASVCEPPERAPVLRLTPPSPPEAPPPAAGVCLDLGPQLFHSGSTTLRSEALLGLAAPETVLLAPEDARRLGIERGDAVRASAGGREVLLRAEVNDRIRPGTAMALWGGDGSGAGRLVTDPARPLAAEIGRHS